MKNSSNSNPLVSIGIPVYNGEQYLAECLESILNQTYQNWECFIINNKSNDNSPQIARSFEEHDSRFRLITNSDFVDVTTNFNNAFKPVSKEAIYFKLVCADDWLFPEYLSRMVELMEKYPEAGLCSSYRIDDKTVSCFGLDYYRGPLFHGKNVLINQLMNTPDVTGSTTTVLYRVEMLEKIKTYPIIFNNSSLHFDTALAYELLNMSDFAFVFQVLSYTRRHEQTLTSKIAEKYYTWINFRESELFKYKSGEALLEKEYSRVRSRYGYFLFIRSIAGDKQCLEWHRQHMAPERIFKPSETLMIVIKTLTKKFRNLLFKFVSLGKDRS